MQKLLSYSVFGNLQIFSINAEGFGSEEKVLRGRDIKRFWEEMGWEFAGYGIKMSAFIIRRTFKKLFYSMNYFGKQLLM